MKCAALIVLLSGIWFCSIGQINKTKTSFKPFFEKIFLHTDRNQYGAKEDIWFKAYLVNAQNNQLIGSSNNLYVELISPTLRIIERQVVRIDNGTGNGDFKLPDTIATGTYLIRAYTNWVRNFGDNFIFEKQIRIFGKEESKVNSSPPLRRAVSSHKEKDAYPQSADISINNKCSLSFFPESGSLLEGVSGVVAFKAEDFRGKPISATGGIYTDSGEKILDFQCDSLGMGIFIFQPMPGLSYISKGIFANGDSFSTKITKARSNGCSLNVRSTDSLFKINIITNRSSLLGFSEKNLFLTGRCKGKVQFATKISLKDLNTTLSILKTSLPEGITALTLYSEGIPLCERLIYNGGTTGDSLAINGGNQPYLLKGINKLTVKLTTRNQQLVKANLSLAIVDAEVIETAGENIRSYLNLRSEIKGKITNIDQYFNESEKGRFQKLDLLMLTQGWRDFLWKRLADSSLRLSYPVEQGITVSGHVREIFRNKAIPNANITLFALKSTGNHLFSTQTDSLGRYFFDAIPLFGKQELKLTSRDKKGKKSGWITVDSLFNPPPAIHGLNETLNGDSIKDFAFKQLLQKSYHNKDTILLKEVNITDKKHIKLWDQMAIDFGYPEEAFEIKPADSVYTSLEHFLATKLTYNNDITLSTADSKGRQILKFPRIFVDGKEVNFRTEMFGDVVMANTLLNTYFQLPMSAVRKVIVRRVVGTPMTYYWYAAPSDSLAKGTENYLRQSLAPGRSGKSDIYIIYLTLVPGAFDKKEYDIANLEVNGYQNARVFYTPKHSDVGSVIDFGPTVYWNANLVLNDNGEVEFTFDNHSASKKLKAVIEGITSNGVPVSNITTFINK